jgi:PPM family protein phosphatase
MSEHSAADALAVSGEPLVVQAVLRTDVGLVRSENQDFGIYTTPSEEREAHPGGRLLVVADGMGGHRGGATASRIAGETVKAQYLGAEGDDIPGALRDSLTRANSRIFHEAQANPDLRGMGTTTSALVVRDGNAWFGHVGDSRIYLVRGNEISQLTDDHSLVATMVREGLLTKVEAENHPRRNVLQRSMGVSEQVEIDVRGPFPLQEGDVFVLCSDGLHGVVKEDEIREVAGKPLREAADEFIRRAIERGAPDNVTVIVARVVRASDVGDDTLVDGAAHLEETQRDTAKIPAFDEKIMEEQAAAVAPPPSSAPPPSPEASVEAAAPAPVEQTAEPAAAPARDSDATAPTLEVPVPAETALTEPVPESVAELDETLPIRSLALAPEAPAKTPPAPAERKGKGGWKWIALVILILGAAGAWFYWIHPHIGPPATTRSSH